MSTNEVSITARRGRRCGVCSLTTERRTALEAALAEGVPISRISRQDWSPARDSIRHHIAAGHLPQQLQDVVERVTGMDSTTVAARITDIARRARTSAMEAAEAGNSAALARANDNELRALAALSALGEVSEREIELRVAHRDITLALFRIARRDHAVAHAVADELEAMHRPILAEDLRDQTEIEN